jgi:hypothetical protein
MLRITNNPNRNLECTRPVLFLIFLEGALKQNDLFCSSCRSPLKPRPIVSELSSLGPYVSKHLPRALDRSPESRILLVHSVYLLRHRY